MADTQDCPSWLNSAYSSAVIAQILPILVGGGFIAGAVHAAVKGAVPLKAGGAINKGTDPLGFWGAIIGITVIGLYLIWLGTR